MLNPFQKSNAPQMTVAHVTEPVRGGVPVYVCQLAEYQLQSGRFAGVHVICPPEHPRALGAEHWHYTASRSARRIAATARNVTAHLNEIQPDVIHAHGTFAGVYSRWRSPPAPVVYCPQCWSFAQQISPFKKQIYAAVERKLARRTAAVINVSRCEYDESIRRRVKTPQNVIIYNGVRDIRRGDASANSGNRPLNTDPSKINLGFIGRLDRQKGFDRLQAAFTRCLRDDLTLYVIGEPEREKNRRGRAATPIQTPLQKAVGGDDPRIHFLGWIDNESIDEYIAMFDAVIVPSRWEGLPLVVCEVMRNARPAIVSDRPPMPETIIEGYNGRVFDLDDPDSLPRILQQLDKQELTRMGANARSVFEQSFHQTRAFEEITRLYVEVTRERTIAAPESA